MAKEAPLNISAIVVLLAGAIMLIYAFYFMQQLAFSAGVYSGLSTAIKAYNVSNKTAGTVLVAALSQSTTLVLALHLTYALLPFAILVFALGVIWLFSQSYYKFTNSLVVMSAILYAILVAVLQFDFSFKNTMYSFPIAYFGAALAVAIGAYSIIKIDSKTPLAKRMIPAILINPETPYSNMKILSNRLMKKLSGEIKILDMHFDLVSLDTLMQLVDKNTAQYTAIHVLTKSDRLGDGFERPYSNFKKELENKKVKFELRILDPENASKQHERLLMDNSTAYKIPPLNIINKKSEHIVGINYREAQSTFNHLWAEAKKFENMKAEPNNLQ
jgi:hypothetical protein